MPSQGQINMIVNYIALNLLFANRKLRWRKMVVEKLLFPFLSFSSLLFIPRLRKLPPLSHPWPSPTLLFLFAVREHLAPERKRCKESRDEWKCSSQLRPTFTISLSLLPGSLFYDSKSWGVSFNVQLSFAPILPDPQLSLRVASHSFLSQEKRRPPETGLAKWC